MDAAALRRHLVQLGLAERETKPIVLAYLDAAAFRRDVSAPYEYWRAEDGSSGVARVEAAERSGEQIRKTLIAIYGPDAQDDPALRDLQASGRTVAILELPATDRRARLQVERGAAGTPTPMIAEAGPASSSGPPGATPYGARRRADPRILRDEATYREYAMRESSLAHRLRAAGVAFTEQEYRAVFELMDDYRASAPPRRPSSHSGRP